MKSLIKFLFRKKIIPEILREFYEFEFFSANSKPFSRSTLPHYLNSLNLLGIGVEIGVQKGYYSDHILTYWEGEKLYSIDPWKHFSGEYIDSANVSQLKQLLLYLQTKITLKKYKNRSCILRMTSKEASKKIVENLDFVYIDAQHHYEAVKEDLEIWYPKIRQGGIIAGHDYYDGIIENSIFGVKKAVDEFAKNANLSVELTKESKDLNSWYIIKK